MDAQERATFEPVRLSAEPSWVFIWMDCIDGYLDNCVQTEMAQE
jgi:hypothetical protein